MTKTMKTPLHQSTHHESATGHVSGRATYVDDLPPMHGMLIGQLVSSSIPRGTITKLDTAPALAVPGVVKVLTAKDIPGTNDVSALYHDEPLFSEGEVYCIGQPIALVLGRDAEACRLGVEAVVVEYEKKEAILTVKQAIAADAMHEGVHILQRGDVEAELKQAHLRLSGELESGGQDHFYLETHVALAQLGEAGDFHIYSSTQHPSEVQHKVAEVLGISSSKVSVEVLRMGGGFGGKETQGNYFASLAALGALYTKRPVKIWLNRDQDMLTTGKRHPFYSTYDAGFDAEGHLVALSVKTWSDAGWAHDLSRSILDRYLFHVDNTYYIPALRFEGRMAKTNILSNTAFRGFGGPQGIVVTETLFNRAAHRLGMDPTELRRRNYYGAAPRNMTPYYQEVEASRSERIHQELLASSGYEARVKAVDAFNEQHRFVKRGLGFQPVKFGISFTAAFLNQAGALVHIYSDGSVQLNHGGTEMGQGLHTKMRTIAAHELGVPMERVRVMYTATDKVPNTSATAASSGSDLNGQAVREACQKLVGRLRPVAAEKLGLPAERADEVRFEAGRVYAGEAEMRFDELAQAAYFGQVSLSATGFYRTPDIAYDPERGRGKPFHYFAYGAALLEVELNTLTGEHRVLRADILHDVGDSLIPSIDKGQVEGAFIQGLGWVTREELVWRDGFLMTHSPDTYKIPTAGDAPAEFHVDLLQDATQDDVIHGSKAVGEPPFVLAIGALTALTQAIRASAPEAPEEAIKLAIPATPEAVLRAISEAQKG